jgi:hypothetical protein
LTGLSDGREVVGTFTFVVDNNVGEGVGVLVEGLAGTCTVKLGSVVLVVEGAWLDGCEGPTVRLGFNDALGAIEGI